jgi:hypothetical protein
MTTDRIRERLDQLDRVARLARQRSEACNCYVQYLNREAKFCLRWGAHNLQCPAYSQSLDYVDNLNDEETRNHFEGTC